MIYSMVLERRENKYNDVSIEKTVKKANKMSFISAQFFLGVKVHPGENECYDSLKNIHDQNYHLHCMFFDNNFNDK